MREKTKFDTHRCMQWKDLDCLRIWESREIPLPKTSQSYPVFPNDHNLDDFLECIACNWGQRIHQGHVLVAIYFVDWSNQNMMLLEVRSGMPNQWVSFATLPQPMVCHLVWIHFLLLLVATPSNEDFLIVGWLSQHLQIHRQLLLLLHHGIRKAEIYGQKVGENGETNREKNIEKKSRK